MTEPDDNGPLWIDRRRLRRKFGDRGTLPPVVRGENSWYRPGELLIHVELEDKIDERLRNRGLNLRPFDPREDQGWRSRDKTGDQELNRRLEGLTGFRLWTTDVAVDNLADVVREIQAEFDGRPSVSLNTVLFGEPVYHGGPGAPPEPAEAPASLPTGTAGKGAGPAALTVLDTGMPADWSRAGYRLAGFLQATDVIAPNETDMLDEDSNHYLDQQAAHGLFICGLANRIAPELRIDPGKVLHAAGDGDEATIIAGMDRAEGTVINMSLGGFTEDDQPPPALYAAVRRLSAAGKVIVAAAGNSGAEPEFAGRPFWPAAFAEVIAVGAYDPANDEPAEFTNRGSWVDVCAPGVNILSDFVSGWPVGASGPWEMVLKPFPHFARRLFHGWARWSGTSFAAPMIAAEIAQLVEREAPSDAVALAWKFIESLPDSPWMADLGKFYRPAVDVTG